MTASPSTHPEPPGWAWGKTRVAAVDTGDGLRRIAWTDGRPLRTAAQQEAAEPVLPPIDPKYRALHRERIAARLAQAQRQAEREARAALLPREPSAEDLRTAREAAGLSQRRLADLAGVTRGYVADLERGRRNSGGDDARRRVGLALAAAAAGRAEVHG